MNNEELEQFLLRMEMRVKTYAKEDPAMSSLVTVQRLDITRLLAIIKANRQPPREKLRYRQGFKKSEARVTDPAPQPSGVYGNIAIVNAGEPEAKLSCSEGLGADPQGSGAQVIDSRLTLPNGALTAQKPISANECAKREGMTVQAIIHHLEHGHIAGAVKVAKEGGKRGRWQIPVPYVLMRGKRGGARPRPPAREHTPAHEGAVEKIVEGIPKFGNPEPENP